MWKTIMAILLMAMPTAGANNLRALQQASNETAADEPDEFPFPENRFTPWQQLDYGVRAKAMRRLGYQELNWNLPGTAPVEALWWEGLSAAQKAGAIAIGFDIEPEEVWDCYQNHYSGYDWEELVEYEIDQYYIILGWTEKSWNKLAPPPASDDISWANLTIAEQEAADQVCYFQEIWDGVTMEEWGWWDETETPTTAP